MKPLLPWFEQFWNFFRNLTQFFKKTVTIFLSIGLIREREVLFLKFGPLGQDNAAFIQSKLILKATFSAFLAINFLLKIKKLRKNFIGFFLYVFNECGPFILCYLYSNRLAWFLKRNFYLHFVLFKARLLVLSSISIWFMSSWDLYCNSTSDPIFTFLL